MGIKEYYLTNFRLRDNPTQVRLGLVKQKDLQTIIDITDLGANLTNMSLFVDRLAKIEQKLQWVQKDPQEMPLTTHNVSNCQNTTLSGPPKLVPLNYCFIGNIPNTETQQLNPWVDNGDVILDDPAIDNNWCQIPGYNAVYAHPTLAVKLAEQLDTQLSQNQCGMEVSPGVFTSYPSPQQALKGNGLSPFEDNNRAQLLTTSITGITPNIQVRFSANVYGRTDDYLLTKSGTSSPSTRKSVVDYNAGQLLFGKPSATGVRTAWGAIPEGNIKNAIKQCFSESVFQAEIDSLTDFKLHEQSTRRLTTDLYDIALVHNKNSQLRYSCTVSVDQDDNPSKFELILASDVGKAEVRFLDAKEFSPQLIAQIKKEITNLKNQKPLPDPLSNRELAELVIHE